MLIDGDGDGDGDGDDDGDDDDGDDDDADDADADYTNTDKDKDEDEDEYYDDDEDDDNEDGNEEDWRRWWTNTMKYKYAISYLHSVFSWWRQCSSTPNNCHSGQGTIGKGHCGVEGNNLSGWAENKCGKWCPQN